MFPFSGRNRRRCEQLGIAPKEFFRGLDLGRPPEDFDFVVFDTELTGLNRRRDEIVAIGAVRIKKMRIASADTFHVCATPADNVPAAGTIIHRITPEELRNAAPIQKVLPEFVRFCSTSLLVGHFIGLDMAFINRTLKKHFRCRLHNPCIDTMLLARLYTEKCWESYHDRFNLKVSYNLADLGRQYGLPEFEPHDALEDALQTAYLFLFLTRKLQQMGYRTLKDIHRAGQAWRFI